MNLRFLGTSAIVRDELNTLCLNCASSSLRFTNGILWNKGAEPLDHKGEGIDGTRASYGAELKRTVIVIYPSCSKRLHKPDAGKAKTKAGAAPRSVGYSVDPG